MLCFDKQETNTKYKHSRYDNGPDDNMKRHTLLWWTCDKITSNELISCHFTFRRWWTWYFLWMLYPDRTIRHTSFSGLSKLPNPTKLFLAHWGGNTPGYRILAPHTEYQQLGWAPCYWRSPPELKLNGNFIYCHSVLGNHIATQFCTRYSRYH